MPISVEHLLTRIKGTEFLSHVNGLANTYIVNKSTRSWGTCPVNWFATVTACLGQRN